MPKHRRVLAISDLHCGSVVGLTPPRYQTGAKASGRTKLGKQSKLQREMWYEFQNMLADIGPIDVLLYGGDGIDGKGNRSGGTEQITCSLEEQTDMCVECIEEVKKHARLKHKPLPIVGVHGTPFHVSGADGEDWENIVADRAEFTKIGSHEWPEVDGVIFDLKHKVGSSGIPHGRSAAISKEMLWNTLWAEADLQPKAQVFLRGHVHYHEYRGDPTRLGMTLPALQAMGSKYGARQCSGIVHWGMVHFDVCNGVVEDWRSHIVTLKTQKATTTEV